MKRRYFLIGLSLIAPGIGQLAAKLWLRGALELLASLACVLWCLAEALLPIALSMRNMLSDNGGEVVLPDFPRLFASLGLLLLLYVWSIVEIGWLVDVKEDAEPPQAPRP
jgi:hypothetical protein